VKSVNITDGDSALTPPPPDVADVFGNKHELYDVLITGLMISCEQSTMSTLCSIRCCATAVNAV